jgi:L-rhamnose mutarotase
MTDLIERFSLDSKGNLYIDDYWIHINREDHLDFYKINMVTSNNFQKVSEEIKLKEDPLQIKVIETEIEEIKKKYNDDDNELEFGESEVFQLAKYIYNPELKYVKENNNSVKDEDNEENQKDNYEDDDSYEPYIQISGDFNLNNNDFTISNYEVYMVDSNNNLLSYTEIQNDNPLYRITVSSDNKMQLNIIGTKIITYKILESNDINKPIKLEVTHISYQDI